MANRKATSDRRSAEHATRAAHKPDTRRPRYVRIAGAATVGFLTVLFIVGTLTSPKEASTGPSHAPVATSQRPELVLSTSPADATIEQLHEEARRAADELLSKFPQSSEAHQIMALLQKSLRQTDEAAAYWQKAVELAPADPHARAGLALVHLDQGKDRLAADTLEEAITVGCSSPEVYETLATALIRLGSFDRAVEILGDGLTLFPRSSRSWLLLGQTQIQQNDLERAEKSLKKAIELTTDYTDAHYALSSVCTRRGDREAGTIHRKRFAELRARDRRMEDRLALAPDIEMVRQRTAATLCGAGNVCLRNGYPSEGDRLLLRAVAIAPGLPEPYKVLASLYQAQGRISDAITVQRRLVQIESQNVLNHVNLANLVVRSGDLSGAEEILQQALDIHPDTAIVYSCFAQLCMKTGKPQQARSLAQAWIRLEPTPAGYMLLAAACRQLDDPVGSENALKAMRRLESRDGRQSPIGPGQHHSR